ncbi:hypothetical protein [Chryseobacterium cucumeris]|uniref:hypothetical protein n=1 Tax=Chryseobacterium cucumeris TaxID=1813611 RepID=UPI001F4B231A|nr:hypothetical protein [Chryseobacterium cucumeris]
MLFPETIIRTNYSETLHKVVKVNSGCTCARLSDELGYTNTGMHENSPEHIHIWCRDMEDNMKSYFNGFIIEGSRIISIWQPKDEIIIVSYPPKPIQLTLF